MISIQGLHALSEALAHLDPAATQRRALEQAAAQLEASVKQLLSRRPGEDHSAPWFRTGALHDSIEHDASDNRPSSARPIPSRSIRNSARASTRRVRSWRAAAAAEAEDIAHASRTRSSSTEGGAAMIDAYTIGITLALNNGVADGIAAIRRDLAALDRAVDASAGRPGAAPRAAGSSIAAASGTSRA